MNISVAVNLPPEVERQLRAESGDLSSAVRESFAVNLFRRGILTHHELGLVLGFDRVETDALLSGTVGRRPGLAHGVQGLFGSPEISQSAYDGIMLCKSRMPCRGARKCPRTSRPSTR